MNVTLWGVRGSVPTPGEATARYGGNTACVAVASADDSIVILDAGTGICLSAHTCRRASLGWTSC